MVDLTSVTLRLVVECGSGWRTLESGMPDRGVHVFLGGASSHLALLHAKSTHARAMSNPVNGPPGEKTYFEQQREILIGDIATASLPTTPRRVVHKEGTLLTRRAGYGERPPEHQQAEPESRGRDCCTMNLPPSNTPPDGLKAFQERNRSDGLLTGRQRVQPSRRPVVAIRKRYG